jgi:MFS family permease
MVTEAASAEEHAGRRRLQRRALVLAFVAMFASAPGQSFVIAIFVDELLAGTGLSRTAFSTLYALATVISASAMVVLGRAADRFGLRAVWILVCTGLAIACGLASVAGGALLMFVALALLRTFGQGSLPLLGTLLAARWFGRRRGQAIGIAAFGVTAASTVLPPLVVVAVVGLGWRGAFQLLGVATLALVLPLALLVREPQRQAAETAGRAAAGAGFPPALRRARRLPRFELPSRRAARLLLVLAAPPLVTTALVVHAVSLLAARGLSLGQAGGALAVLGAASTVGTLGGGAIADRMTTRLLLSLMSGLLAASPLALLLPGGAAAYGAFALVGLAGGLFGVASGIVWARTYGLAQLGKLQGTSFAASIGGSAVGPLPLAVSLALAGSYVPGLLAVAAFALLTFAVSVRWRDPSRLRRARGRA